jgi:hypothetical protein
VIGASSFVYALAVLYLVIGAGCALGAASAGRSAPGDLFMLVLLWPLYGPFLLGSGGAAPGRASLLRSRERELERALRQVSGTPLARLLPDRAALRALGRSLGEAAQRTREIEALLARPEMDRTVLLARLEELERTGGPVEPRAALMLRLQSIGQLEAMRDRFTHRLAEVDGLLSQLLTQVEVLRLGGVAEAPGQELVGELVTRVEALGEMLEDGRRAAAGR